MANTSRVNGFRPVKHLTGAPYNGQANIYEIAAGETVAAFIGDLVKLSDAVSTSGYGTVEVSNTAAVTATAYLGAIVGIVNAKLDPVDGKMTSGSIALDTPQSRAASTKQLVLVADAADLVYEAEADEALAQASLHLNVGVVEGAGSATTGNSGFQVDASSVNTTSTLPLQILGFSKRVDNEAAGAFNKVLVRINTHAMGNVGVAGV
jgi:hypothetical protein